MAETTYIKAITSTLAGAMRADERVFVLGEDVAEGGPYTATAGLAEEFGTERVINTPISEAAITGVAIGAAQSGMRPGARDHVHRLHHARARPARERRREGALHVGRPADGAAGAAHAGRRRLPRRGAALAEPRELAHARAGPQGRDAEPARRRRRAARERDRRPEPGRLHREQDALLPQGRGSRAARPGADRRGGDAARGRATSRSSPSRASSTTRSPPPSALPPRTGSRPR